MELANGNSIEVEASRDEAAVILTLVVRHEASGNARQYRRLHFQLVFDDAEQVRGLTPTLARAIAREIRDAVCDRIAAARERDYDDGYAAGRAHRTRFPRAWRTLHIPEARS